MDPFIEDAEIWLQMNQVFDFNEYKKTVNWCNEDERLECLRYFRSITQDLRGHYPNILEIFQTEEVELLLLDSIKFPDGNFFIDFVARCGYKGEPDIDENGKPLLRRTTAVHHAAKRWFSNSDMNIPDQLFVIYNDFHVNYSDETGLTHFHAACTGGFVTVVRAFLEFGQDPNCAWLETGDSPLQLAVFREHFEVVKLLLEYGANPNLANAEGLTSLHIVSRSKIE
ncbi:unnamed protein product [Trichogramma brassicae]|uniref:Uncharacterized protein n=1 Tax=Trichogramma brassicae TaxID=86971 RepID=A0A6H5I5R0_9HYME|nr:unnamed protein product [Trichogramma brassicae]